MKYALKTTLAAAVAAICLAGAGATFAADNAGKNGSPQTGGMNGQQDTVITTDPAKPDTTTTGSVTCDDQSTDQQNCIQKDHSKRPHVDQTKQHK
jgi:hypothetical protein